MVLDVCVCGEQRYICGTRGRINQWRKLVGERERERSVLLCRAGSYYTDKKCSVMKTKTKKRVVKMKFYSVKL